MNNHIRKKANDVLWFALRNGHIKNLDHCIKQTCDDVDPITLQIVARSLGFFYSIGHDRFFDPARFLQAFSLDEKANKAHHVDALWMPEVKRAIENLLHEMRADECAPECPAGYSTR